MRRQLRIEGEGRSTDLLAKEEEAQNIFEEEKEELLMLTACADAMWKREQQELEQRQT